jgi:hypothetical protein
MSNKTKETIAKFLNALYRKYINEEKIIKERVRERTETYTKQINGRERETI